MGSTKSCACASSTFNFWLKTLRLIRDVFLYNMYMAIGRKKLISRKAAGQAITEFALTLPIMLIVAIGLFDIGRAYYSLIVVTNASREGARYLSLNGDDSVSIPAFAGTKEAAMREAEDSFITLSTSDVSITGCVQTDAFPGCDSGTPAR